MVRWTMHIDQQWRARMMESSDAQRTSLADVVDEISHSFCEQTLSARQ
jgi:hypothetical protein